MKKLKVFIVSLLSVLAIVAVCLLGACLKYKNSVRIFYETNGGTEIDFVVGQVGSSYKAPADPTYEGYDFGGWYLEPEFKTEFKSKKFPKTDTTLYAKWNESNKYAYITYYGNGVLLKKVPVKKGETLKQPDDLFSVNEKTTGWYTDADMKTAYTFGDVASASLNLYTSFYTKGIQIENGTVTQYAPSTARITTVYVPSVFEGVKVTTIGDDAFVMSSEVNGITKIVLPDTITTIGERAFYDCRYLTSVNVSKNVTSIGKAAFYNNERLTDFGDISSLTEIAAETFLGCKKLSKVTLPEGLTKIGDQAFTDCELLQSINIPSTVTTIGAQAFENCKKLTEITLPAGLTAIGENAFKGCTSLAKVYAPAAKLEQFKTEFGNLKVTNDVLLENLLTAISA